ncbi:MAG: enoyl-CoA hydratase/isomerase family protein, partial [Deltaproteobacteria bacterium]|nr:enoyl-CoA hydratase/isomerase family protein [Deltaproteobacteria bacterium]
MKLSTLCYSEKQENIATVTFDRGKTCDNIADKLFFEELNQCLGLIESKDYLEGLVFSSSGKNFMIGSDIREFSALSSSEDARSMSVYMNQTMERISLLSIPVVCLIHGKCLGPGLELALA